MPDFALGDAMYLPPYKVQCMANLDKFVKFVKRRGEVCYASGELASPNHALDFDTKF
jgi:hypothetical protein